MTKKYLERINKMTLDISVISSRQKDMMKSMPKYKSKFLKITIMIS
jgi:hypothetical protein